MAGAWARRKTDASFDGERLTPLFANVALSRCLLLTMKSISEHPGAGVSHQFRRGGFLEILGSLRVREIRRTVALASGLIAATLMLREVLLLIALPGGLSDAVKIPFLIVLSVFREPFAVFLAAFPLALPIIAFRSHRVGALAALMLGPVTLFGLPWLSRPHIGLDIPALAQVALTLAAVLASLTAWFEKRGSWRAFGTSKPRAGGRVRWFDPDLLWPAGLVAALAVWLWVCLPPPGLGMRDTVGGLEDAVSSPLGRAHRS